MSKVVSRASQTVIDLGMLSLAFWLAFLLRFEGHPPFDIVKRAMFTWPYVVFFQYGVLFLFRVPHMSWRHVSLPDAARILFATGSAAAGLLVVRLAAAAIRPHFGYALYAWIPIGVILIDCALAMLGIAGVRASRRMLAERSASQRRGVVDRPLVPTLLIGAGEAGAIVVKEIRSRPDLGIEPVGFVDDDADKHGSVIHGVRVLGPTNRLQELCDGHGAKQVLITIAGAAGADIRRIKELCDAAEIPAKIIPGIYEIVGGQVSLSRIRKVAIEDLLGRAQVKLDAEAIAGFIGGKVVLVTGAGGSIGSEICRQVVQFGPAKLVLVERFENALFEIHSELREQFPEVTVLPRVADITDEHRMQRILEEARPDALFHAAAHKHVPMMEWNPGEAIKNNVLGTRLLADMAARHGVGHFVMISTDKAVHPSNVMGASKRVAELYVQGMARRSQATTFVSVRFGNVLGSCGSVIPTFKRQIAAGGPVTVTHPEMKRYFMTIPEATQLVLQAATMGRGGEVFILDMGEPVKIVDLARDLIRLSGLEPEQDVEIKFTGIRPGEKLFEELATDEERADKTRHAKIFIGRGQPADWQALVRGIDELGEKTDVLEERQIYAALRGLIPDFQSKRFADAKPAEATPVASSVN